MKALDQILRSTLLSSHTTQPNYRRSFFYALQLRSAGGFACTSLMPLDLRGVFCVVALLLSRTHHNKQADGTLLFFVGLLRVQRK